MANRIEIYSDGELDAEERGEVEEEVNFLEYLIRKYNRNPRDIVMVKQHTKTKKYRKKTSEANQKYGKSNPYKT